MYYAPCRIIPQSCQVQVSCASVFLDFQNLHVSLLDFQLMGPKTDSKAERMGLKPYSSFVAGSSLCPHSHIDWSLVFRPILKAKRDGINQCSHCIMETGSYISREVFEEDCERLPVDDTDGEVMHSSLHASE